VATVTPPAPPPGPLAPGAPSSSNVACVTPGGTSQVVALPVKSNVQVVVFDGDGSQRGSADACAGARTATHAATTTAGRVTRLTVELTIDLATALYGVPVRDALCPARRLSKP
jgi:hypothetical protein